MVDVRPALFPTTDDAIYTRSFEELAAYREVASLSGPLEHVVVKPDDLPALAVAVQSLFDSRFYAEVETVGLGFDWNGRGFGSLDVEGMGEDGEHPGALVNAFYAAFPAGNGWRLSLVTLDGTELGAAVWVTGASE